MKPTSLPQVFALWLSRQRLLPYKARRSVIKRLYPAMLADFPFETDFFQNRSGLRFRGNAGNYIDRMVYFCGAYEKYMLSLLRDYAQRLESLPVFMDIGANAGNHALFMSQYAERVHAFEPFERVRKQMEANVALNGIANITVYPFGLSDAEKALPFYAAPDSNLGASSFRQDHKPDSRYLGDMQLKRGDEVVRETGIGRIDIIKIDVEGYEKPVLIGLKEMLLRDRPLIIVELSPTTRRTLAGAAAFAALFPPEYDFFYFAMGRHDSGRYRLAPFDYRRSPKIHDVIACPREKLKHLGDL